MPVLDKRIDLPVTRAEAFRFWQEFWKFPQVMPLVQSVEVLSKTHSRWEVKAPFGTSVGFDAEIVEVEAPAYMRWRSTHGTGPGTVESGGELFFEPLDGGHTHVHLRFRYELGTPEAAQIAQVLASLGYPAKAFDEALEQVRQHFAGKGE
jgi:uncharacterized membrane protein